MSSTCLRPIFIQFQLPCHACCSGRTKKYYRNINSNHFNGKNYFDGKATTLRGKAGFYYFNQFFFIYS